MFPSLFNNDKYSDLTIVCGAKRYPVHRALLATRSSFFEGACRNSFLEAETGVINLSEDEAEVVEHMVHCKHVNVAQEMCAKAYTIRPRLLSHGLPEQYAITSLFATIIAANLAAVVTSLEAHPAQEVEPCPCGRSAPSDHISS
jgi:hypothetical protein